MIRRDYILRMIEEFFRALARINNLKKLEQWEEAASAIDDEFKRLIGRGADSVSHLSEAELLASVIQSESTAAVRDKTLILAALLKEGGDVAAAQGKINESQAFYLKALHLMLDLLSREEVFEIPAFVPAVDLLVQLVREAPLSTPTCAMLMQYYEQTGQFAKAEDALFAILEVQPAQRAVLEFGLSFYRRLESRSDAALSAGNLPRTEVEAGVAELRKRCTKPLSSQLQ